VRLMGENNITTSAPVTTMRTTSSATTSVVEPPAEPTTPVPERVVIDTDMPENHEMKNSFVIDDFQTVMQEPELPTGCEITALTQTMNYYGFDVDKVELCDVFMSIDHDGYYTMNEAYLGDPHATNGFGCNAPVIVSTANDYFEYIGSDWYAVDLTGISLEEVFYQVEQGRPVVIWTTIGQRETHAEFQFELGCGEDFYFNPFQHCTTIYGYDYSKGTVHIADPLVGNTEYDMERFGRIYEVMESQAVILVGNDETAGKVYSTEEDKKKWLDKNRPKEDEKEEATEVNVEATE
ncbi:MAG: C39 family peptidase, partial [Ruminococcus sp.]|nr:C39 family peptidase [Ruminococcus sp.]